MIEIRKCSFEECKSDKNFDINSLFVGIFENNTIVEFASYLIDDNALCIKFISNYKNDYSLLDALIKTMIFYADINKIRYIKLSANYQKIAEYFNFKCLNNEYILDIYNQNNINRCECERNSK